MGKTCRARQPEQTPPPPDPRDWLPAEHLVWFVSDLVDTLDLTAIEAFYEAETRGPPPYHPRPMVKLLVYGYCLGVRSSRKIAQRLDEDVACRALAAGNRPDFRTIADFRKIHLEALGGLFERVLCGRRWESRRGRPRRATRISTISRTPRQRLSRPDKTVKAWVAVEKTKRNAAPEAAPRGRPPAGLGRVERMRRKPLAKAGKRIFARRKAIVEPVFGQIKQARDIRQFLLRGWEKARFWLETAHTVIGRFWRRILGQTPGKANRTTWNAKETDCRSAPPAMLECASSGAR